MLFKSSIVLCVNLLLIFFIVGGQCDGAVNVNLPHYKMCVPHHIFLSCKKLMSTPSEYAVIDCIPGRDRMDCLEKVNKREADFLAADPEDMYVAFNMNNEDFSVFSEIRTVEEPEAEFRYEGILLVHRDSNIRTISDLKGRKSCHTGFGRNVGYKIPITKLKKMEVLKISQDPSLSPVEKELKGLSELFSGSCLVGTYSPNDEINRALKKRYSNLCALCEDPVKCNYPDKYSGYDGAIRCLVQNGGDVAFTKVIYVRRFFGLPIGNNPPKTTAEANPDDYEYLCTDGTRKPVTGPACTWAQRPWQGYMGNADVKTRLTKLQNRISAFYNEGKRSPDKKAATDMWIKEENLVVKKEKEVLPGDHLIRAQYKDVIERDGSFQTRIRLCVKNNIELIKCNTMRTAAYSRDIRPEFECVLNADCIQSVANSNSDAAVIKGNDIETARKMHLKAILHEETEIHYVAVCRKDIDPALVKKAGIFFDADDPKALNAAATFNMKRDLAINPKVDENGPIMIVRSDHLVEDRFNYMELICPDFSRSPLTESEHCNFDASMPLTIMVRESLNGKELNNVIHGFISLSDSFGRGGKLENVFELFGEFEVGQKNVIFSDDGTRLF